MRHSLGIALALVVSAFAQASAADTAADIVKEMKAALEPERPSLRKLTITTNSPFKNDSTRFVAAQARKRTPAGERVVTVLLAPDGPRGIAWLIQEGKDQTVQWLWTPVVGRVRKLFPLPGYEAFVESDFTYSDLGLVDLNATPTLLGDDTLNGRKTHRVQVVPASNWYYSRIVSWVDADSHFPLKREFYDSAGQLWKVETFDRVTDIQGMPTVLHFRMENLQEKVSTDIEVTGVQYGTDVPDSLFEVGQLPKTAAAPIWGTLGP